MSLKTPVHVPRSVAREPSLAIEMADTMKLLNDNSGLPSSLWPNDKRLYFIGTSVMQLKVH